MNENTPEQQSMLSDVEMQRVLAYSRFIGLILRKSRILAYSTEVAESVRHSQPKYVKPLYALNFAYIGLDIGYNTWAMQKYGEETTKYKFLDLCVFHAFASFIIPTVFIHSVVSQTRQFVVARKFSPNVIARAPLFAGLGMIPLIIHPIDTGVEWVMDKFLRAYFPKQVQNDLVEYHHHSNKE